MEIELKFIFMLALAISCMAHRGYPNTRFDERRSYIRGYSYQNPLHDRWRDGEIPGLAGRDHSIFRKVPRTRFECTHPGYYADPETDCRTYHVCQRNGRKDTFLCPYGTLFNQEGLVCSWWYTVDCTRAQSFYSINEAVAKAMEEADRRIKVKDAEKTLSRGYQHKFKAGKGSWNKYNQQGKPQGWIKDIIPILSNRSSYFLRKLPYEAPKFFAKSFSNASARYGNFYTSRLTYNIVDGKYGKQKTKSGFTKPTNFYLPTNFFQDFCLTRN